MSAKKITTWPTEADLEAEIHGTVKRVFPWLPAGAVRHQTKFSFKFGHKNIPVDGAKASRAEARSDVILYHGERPLAVLELKRKGVPLTAGDLDQGLSYARVLNPWPPLVVVSNGENTRIIETYSGKDWQPKQSSQEAFQILVTSAAAVATADMKMAIDSLMGTNATVWMQAVRHVSADTISDLSASWEKPALPFASDLLIPRKATAQVLNAVECGAKLVLVEGAPLAGKSNVLRELTLGTAQHDNVGALFIEGGVGHGVLQSIADALGRALAWPITKDEARSWLVRLSRAAGPRLLLAIDGLDVMDTATRKDIEDLTSAAFGARMSLVVSLDDASAEKLVKAPNGLTDSAIGRKSLRVPVIPLDDDEYRAAQHVLLMHRIGFMHGAHATPEFRQPWVLRAVSAQARDRIGEAELDRIAVLPPLLSLDLIKYTRVRFTDQELRRRFKAVAAALLADAKDQTLAASLKVESFEINLVSRKTLKEHMEAEDLTWLMAHGFLKPAIHASGVPVLYVRLPELVASELAILLADELAGLARDDPKSAADWLAGAATNLPIGDVIAAQAIFDAVPRPGSLPFNLIMALLEKAPRREQVSPGMRVATHLPEVGMVEMHFKEDGTADVEIGGELHTLDLGVDGLSNMYSDIHQWLILSHLAALPFAMETDEGLQRVDPGILMGIGKADVVLRKPGGDPEMRSAPTHDLPGIGSIVCHEAGIIEPITLSIFRFLGRAGADADEWIEAAISADSVPLLARIHIALLQLASLADDTRSSWARSVLDANVMPAFKLLSEMHTD